MPRLLDHRGCRAGPNHRSSGVDGAHVAVPVADDGVARDGSVEGGEVVVRRASRRAAPTFSSRYFTRLVPGIGATPLVVALGQHPGERELAGGAALLVGDRADLVDELEVGVEGPRR